MPDADSENEPYHAETVGDIGDVEVTIEVEGDECLAELIYTELVGAADEVKQIVDHDVPPEATDRMTKVDWEAYQNEELPKQEAENGAE